MATEERPTAILPLTPKRLVSHYRIVEKLGAGGMGEVWLAEDTRLKRKVALKLLPAELTADAERVRRFEQEAQAASALSHPNIITVYDIGECEAGRYIVMELVAGRTLRSVIAQETSLETFLSLSQQMAKALSAAHAAGITHRDIKPDNIMVRDDGYVKVLDFGLARLRPATESDSEAVTMAQQTTPGTIMGTVAYMSPEQARGESVSHPSDVFALGIVLYELTTGRHPFKAETLMGYLHAITLQEPAPPQQWQPKLPAALNELLLRMLSKEASQRPTANEVAQVLQAVERGENPATRQRSDAGIENETMMLPSVGSGATATDEGFWVAVLPFKWRGANAELEALAEGLSEDIVTGLSRFSYLRVIARSSTLRFTGEASDVRAIGKELGARYVMEGSLRQAGAMLRIAVQLVDATTGAHLWAETYDRQFRAEDIFALQDDLVPPIVSTVADQYGALVHSMSESLRGRSAASYSAHEAVLRAFGYLERISPEEHAEVRAILEAAVAATPGHSNCHAMLSLMYWHEYANGYNAGPDPLGRAYAAAQQAVAAAPANQLAHYALANVLFYQKDFPAFRPVAERALALNRMDASTTALIGTLIAYAGDWEYGLEVVGQARQLNPHHPGWYHLAAFYDAYRRQDYRYALENILRVNMPGYYSTYAGLAATYGQLGEQERARAALRELHVYAPKFGAYARSGFSRWFDAELTEQLIDGLRKAGLVMKGENQIAASLPLPAPEPDAETADTQLKTSPTQSIAVLPFANISADEENEYFCDGLAEELLNALAKIDELKVAARTSAFSFKGKNAEAREIGTTLYVNTVLEGSVRKSGNRIRINVQLVNAADGYHLWSERYDREMKDIFDVQDEITLAVVDALKVKLLGAKKAAVLKRYTDNTEAYQLYLKGRFHYSKWTEAGYRKAIEYYEQALASAPDYALAYAGIADACVLLWYWGYDVRPEVIARQQAAVAKALELDDELSDVWRSQALLQSFIAWDFAAAGYSFEHALTLNPNDALAHAWYGFWLMVMGQCEQAVVAARRARALDPVALFTGVLAGWTLWFAQQYDEGFDMALALLELDPHFAEASRLLGCCYWQKADFPAAEKAMQQALAEGEQRPLPDLCMIYAHAGKLEEARQILQQLLEFREERNVSALWVAYCYIGLGEFGEAFAWLEKALTEHNGELFYFGSLPEWIIPFQQDPRFTDLLRRIGLPTEEPPQTNVSLEANTMLLTPNVSSKPAGAPWAATSRQRHTVGREPERNELRTAFHAAKDGRGALMCVAGEPGIGKTTLVEDFLTELTTDNACTIARGRCSERLAGTEAYLPLLEALESLLQSDKKLAATMKQLAPTWYAQVVPLNSDSEESARLLNEVKAASQERMKRELAAFLQTVATPQPLVIFFDDLHWADVSTIDLLSFLAGKFDVLRVLIVVTYRPSDMLLAKHPFLQIKPDLQARGVCRELSLEFLTEAEIADYLTLEFPRHAFPPDFAKLIHAKTEGSPLFMADLVRYLRDRGVIAVEGSTQDACVPRLVQTLPDIERELPESVRGMIERKIAQLSEEDRKLLTAASVQGYEFDSAVVAQVLKQDADEVEERLEKLERVFAFVKLVSEAEFPNRTLTLKYRFVHVLYQNALYAALRLTRKATLSREVAQTLEGFYGEQRTNVANALAALYEVGREYARAGDAFLQAARQAAQINAHREAVQLAERGLAALLKSPETPERDGRELGLQLTLGFSLQSVLSWAAPKAGVAFNRARQLCQQMGDDPRLVAALSGVTIYHLMRAEFVIVKGLCEQMMQLAEQAQDPVLLVMASMHWAALHFYQGELVSAHQHGERALALDRREYHEAYFSFFNEDLGIMARRTHSYSLWALGYPDRALALARESITLAEQTSHPFSLGGAHFTTGPVLYNLRDWQSSQQEFEKVIALAEEYALGDFLNYAITWKSLTLAYQEPTAAALERAKQAIESLRATGVTLAMTGLLASLGEVFRLADRCAEGLETIAEALARIERTRDRVYETELWRIKGELLLKANASNAQAEAESCFQQAIQIAQQQSAKSWELRAATSLARLWQRQGKREEARQMLAEIYGWFTEGFDTADLRDAKALLEELTARQS